MATKTTATFAVYKGKTNVSELTDEKGHKAYLTQGTAIADVVKSYGATGFDVQHTSNGKHVFFLMKDGKEVTRFHLATALQQKTKQELASMKLQACEQFNTDKASHLNAMKNSLQEVLMNAGFTGAELKEALKEEGLDDSSINSQCWTPTICSAGDLKPLEETKFAWQA